MEFILSAFGIGEKSPSSSSNDDGDENDETDENDPGSGSNDSLSTAEGQIEQFASSADGIASIVSAHRGVKGTPQGITLTEVSGVSTLPACYNKAKETAGVTFVNFNISDSKCRYGTQSFRTGPMAYTDLETSVTVCNPADKYPYNGCGEIKKVNGGVNWGVLGVEGKGLNGYDMYDVGPFENKTLDECAAEAEEHPKARAFTRTDTGQCFIKSYGVLGAPYSQMVDGHTTWRRYNGPSYTPPIDSGTFTESLSGAKGWPGAQGYKEFNLSGGKKVSEVNSVEECRQLAAGSSENINTFAVRTSDNPSFPNTCIGLIGDSFPNQANQAAWVAPESHITSCVDTANKLSDGCVNPEVIRKATMVFPADISTNATMSRGFDDVALERQDITTTSTGAIPNRSECMTAAQAANALAVGYDASAGSCYMIKKGFLGVTNDAHPTRWMECTNGHPIANGCHPQATTRLILTSEGWSGAGARFTITNNGTDIEIAPGVYFQKDGNLVIRNGSAFEWASHWRNNRLTLKKNGDLWYDNADGNYGKSLLGTPWNFHHRFGGFDAPTNAPGEARGPFGLWWVMDGAKRILQVVDRHGALVWATSTGLGPEVKRRKTEAFNSVQTDIAANNLDKARGDMTQWKNQRLLTQAQVNSFNSMIDAKIVQQDTGLALMQSTSVWGGRVLISTSSTGAAAALTKATPKTVAMNGYSLNWQADGNLVVYKSGKAVWASGTGHSTEPRRLFMQDHNLLISNGRAPIWDLNGSMGAGIPTGTGIAHFGMRGDGRLLFMRSRSSKWISAVMVEGHISYPRMGDRPGTAMVLTGGKFRGYKMPYTDENDATACAKHCTEWRGMYGFASSWVPKSCGAFSYNETTKKCAKMDVSKQGTVGEVVNGFTYYKRL